MPSQFRRPQHYQQALAQGLGRPVAPLARQRDPLVEQLLAQSLQPSKQVFQSPWGTLAQLGAVALNASGNKKDRAASEQDQAQFMAAALSKLGEGNVQGALQTFAQMGPEYQKLAAQVGLEQALGGEESKPVTLADAAQLVDPKTGRVIAENVKETPDKDDKNASLVTLERKDGTRVSYDAASQQEEIKAELGAGAIVAPSRQETKTGVFEGKTDQAGKAAQVESGRRSLEIYNNVLFDGGDPANSDINESIVLGLASPIKLGGARTANTAISEALETKLRLETGAAAPEPEIQRLKERFLPSPLDLANPETIRIKSIVLGQFLDDASAFVQGESPDWDDINNKIEAIIRFPRERGLPFDGLVQKDGDAFVVSGNRVFKITGKGEYEEIE